MHPWGAACVTMGSSECQELRGRVPHACEHPGLDTKPTRGSWPHREPLLPLCQLSLPMADLLARAEATGTFVKVYLKHVAVLAWFQGSDDWPSNFSVPCCEANLETAKGGQLPNSSQYLCRNPSHRRGEKTALRMLALPLLSGEWDSHTSFILSQPVWCLPEKGGPGVPIPFFPSLPDGKGG